MSKHDPHKARRERRRCFRSFIAICLQRAAECRAGGQRHHAIEFVSNAKRHRLAAAIDGSRMP